MNPTMQDTVTSTTDQPGARAITDVTREAARRRTFAVISHPDAGKSTLTEALALHAQVITEAGAVHGKAGRRSTVSDWMEMEKARGISITSAALQFAYGDHVVNLVDTPGHSDFSEDTYRVLSAVDCAVMLIDAAKGLEPQTLKLFRVCKARGIPVITVINKWDRPGLDPLALMDEIYRDIGLQPTPLTWPVGIAGRLQGCAGAPYRGLRRLHAYGGRGEAGAGGTAGRRRRRRARGGRLGDRRRGESTCSPRTGPTTTRRCSSTGSRRPCCSPRRSSTSEWPRSWRRWSSWRRRRCRSPTSRGSGATSASRSAPSCSRCRPGMDTNHRDRVAFARVTSGVFERGMVVTHAQSGRPFATKYAQAMFGRERTVLDEAYPGDIIGLVNATSLRPGDSLFLDPKVEFPPIATFAPEHFAVATSADTGRFKQFRKGIDQLDSEGVVQVLRSDLRGNQSPVLAAVGPMQFEVAQARMESEFGAPIRLEHLAYTQARRTDAASAAELDAIRSIEVLSRNDGTLLVLAPDKWRISTVERDHPGLTLEPLLAGEQ